MSSISIQKTSITRLEVDAIVNAANSRLQNGGGVCGGVGKIKVIHLRLLLGAVAAGFRILWDPGRGRRLFFYDCWDYLDRVAGIHNGFWGSLR